MTERHDCPGCGSTQLTGSLILPSQPVVLNYRFPTPVAAQQVERRDIHLRQCEQCGLIFNATFEPDIIPYDENYENRQCHSTAFEEHLISVASSLVEYHRLEGGTLLEVGCGKGDFLKLICRLAGAGGDGYDTSYLPGPQAEPPHLQFYSQYVTAAEIRRPYQAVLCRHVIEHVPEIGSFLKSLHEIAVAAGNPVIALETPRVEWIFDQLSFWDLFYEHCNYFSEPTLAYLCRQAGFEVVRHRRVFGEQYQLLELRIAPGPASEHPPGILETADLLQFARLIAQRVESLSRRISDSARGLPWGIWGAGAKGVSLANRFPDMAPALVIDSNPAKQGGVISGTSIPIVAPDDSRILQLQLVMIANPNYAPEMAATLQRIGFTGTTLTL